MRSEAREKGPCSASLRLAQPLDGIPKTRSPLSHLDAEAIAVQN